VIYELHVGTFTPEGTFAAAARRLPDLAALGITAVELMPVSHFPGRRGWGYDPCLLLAPHPAYGTPEDLKRFVEAAQALGVMVILDLVLNHVSPEGSDLHRIAPDFFDEGEPTPWGAAVAFGVPEVRQFAFDVCLAWITEYRLDGLRLDAVHQIRDPHSETHVLVELGRQVRAADWGRPVHLVTEDDRNVPDLREPDAVAGRPLYDASWNDDSHHAVRALLTGDSHAYLRRFAADPLGDLAKALAEGSVEVGQPREGQEPGEPPRGRPTAHLAPTAFVNFNQNHDQVGNRPGGLRLIDVAPEGAAEVAHGILLLAPFVPMLFMGEEEGERTPFHYFSDMSEELGALIREGRRREFAVPPGQDYPDPQALATFEASRPFAATGSDHARRWRDLTARLLRLRAERVVPLLRSGRAGLGGAGLGGPGLGGAVGEAWRLGPRSLRARWRFHAGTLAMWANLGSPPDAGTAGHGPPDWRPDGPPDFALGDAARDPYALAVTASHA
jgi:malto-oligosyltrehalose trehalohydrolase